MDGIFISYRREDSAGYAGRLYDRLAGHFGPGQVFMDVEGIDPGTDFVDAIERAVTSCKVLIVLIGDKWVSIEDASGRRRIDDPHDFIRIETSTALKRDIRVVPVLLEGVPMPRVDELPDDLALLSRRQAITIRHKQWESSTGELIETLDKLFTLSDLPARPAIEPPQRPGDIGEIKPDTRSATSRAGIWTAVGLACAVLAGFWMVWRTAPQPADPGAAAPVRESTTDVRPAPGLQQAGRVATEIPRQKSATLPAKTVTPLPTVPEAAAPAALPTPSEAATPAPVAIPTEAPPSTPPVTPAPIPAEAPTPAPAPLEKPKTPPVVTDLPAPVKPVEPVPKPKPPARPAVTRKPATRPATDTAGKKAETARPAGRVAEQKAGSRAPTGKDPGDSKLPAVGDHWVYRIEGLWASTPVRTIEVSIRSADERGVQESLSRVGGGSRKLLGQREVSGPTAHIVDSRRMGTEFSPYLGAFGGLAGGSSWRGIPTPDTDSFWTGWHTTGKVKGREVIKVPAGNFRAVKIGIQSSRGASGSSAERDREPVRVQYGIWYAPEIKRYVKMVRKVTSASGQTVDLDTFELLRYHQKQ